LLGLLAPLSARADGADVTGAACQPGQGVTVVVDYSLDGTKADVRCAPGASGTVLDAFQKAGFVVTDASGFVTAIDGIDPAVLYGWQGWWALYTSTTSGTASGLPGDAWRMAQVGAMDGPVSTDQAYLFRVFDSWDCMLADSMPGYTDAMDDPSVCVPTPALSDLPRGDVMIPAPPSAAQGSPDAGWAAAWIASQLAATGDVALGGASPDWGLTLDAIFALASSGVGADQLMATAQKVYASGTAYIGPQADVSTAWAKIAKTVLGLEVAGLDPAAFPVEGGTRNLLADLRSVMNADGSFGRSGTDSVFSHPLAMLALARTSGGVPAQATAWMTRQQCTDPSSANQGSYGWSPDCSAPDVDSTAMVVQALRSASVPADDPAIATSEQWLASQQDATGGFSSFGVANANSTGLAAQALQTNTEAAADAAGFIGALQVTCEALGTGDASVAPTDLGAIAYDRAGFDSALTDGLQPGTAAQFLRASVQAVLGLGGPQFASLSVTGMDRGLPVPACEAPEDPSEKPTTPSGTDPTDDTSSAPSAAITAPTGGSVAAPSSAMPMCAVISTLGGVVLLRRWALHQ